MSGANSASVPSSAADRNTPSHAVHTARERRDTLFLLAVCGLAIAPLLPQLPAWCSVLTLGVLGWRAWLAWAGRPLPGRIVVSGLLLGVAGLTWWQEGTLLGRQAGVTMLAMLMALKTLELRARRDALVVFFLGCFLALALFLYSQTPAAALAAFLSTGGLLTALALAHMPAGRPTLAQAAGVALRGVLWGLPAALALVLLFPRIGPLWALPDDQAGRSGLSGTLRLGGVAELALDDSVALRVRFDGLAPAPSAMYFRGPVLAHFDGLDWTRGDTPAVLLAPLPEDVQPLGPALHYTLVLEPGRLPVLPLPELTPGPLLLQSSGDIGVPRRRSDLQWRMAHPATTALRVEATAHPQARHGTRAGAVALRDLVDLPPGHNPRTLEWAAALRRDPRYTTADAATLVQVVLGHLQRGGYGYTLTPGLYGRDAVDEFWFDRRLGFCEHFAAAFVVMMRALDVPARVVTGYQGADPVPEDGWWTVRQHHAHAWAEVWQSGQGWQRVDPTAAVAPERVTLNRTLRPTPGLLARALDALDPSWTAAWQRTRDNLQRRWNEWVVGYSLQQQWHLMKQLGIPNPDIATLARALAMLGALSALTVLALLWWRRPRPDDWQALHKHVARRLAQLGMPAGAHESPGQRARQLRERYGDVALPLADVLAALEQARYAPGGTAGRPGDWQRRFDRAWRACRGRLRSASAEGDSQRPAPQRSAMGQGSGQGSIEGNGVGRGRGNRRTSARGGTAAAGGALLLAAALLATNAGPRAAMAAPATSPAVAAVSPSAGDTPAPAPAASTGPTSAADSAAPGAADATRPTAAANSAAAAKRTAAAVRKSAAAQRKAAKAKAAAPTRPRKAAVGPQAVNLAEGTAYGTRDDMLQFATLVTQRHGLEPGWAQKHLADARLLPQVQRLIMPPPAGTARNWAAYRERFVEPRRIAAGVAFWRQHAQWLELAEARWGVPASLVVGVIGVETLYGRHMGGFRALDALATLAFDFPPGRRDRSAFFRDELEELLLLARREGVEPASYRSSFAGALGLPQFMPSSIRRYAVDFDGDGRVDLLGNPADAIGSVANYLAAFGWQRDLPTHYPVAAPVDTADRAVLLAPDIVPTFTAAQFSERGAALQGDGARHPGLLALVELQNGDAAPSYVAGTSNFYAVTRYNWSSYYALAVIDLGRAVAKAMPVEVAR